MVTDDEETLCKEATEALERLNRVFAGDTHEPEEPRPLTLHEMLRSVPNNAVSKWKAEGEAIEARRKVADEERKAQEEAHATKLAALAAARSQGECDYLHDMLMVADAQQAAMQRLEDRIAESAEMKAPVLDVPNVLASRQRMQ